MIHLIGLGIRLWFISNIFVVLLSVITSLMYEIAYSIYLCFVIVRVWKANRYFND